MTAEEFFTELIKDADGFIEPKGASTIERTIYTKAINGKQKMICCLEKMTAEGKGMLWVNWGYFYLPMIHFFKMKESEVTAMLNNQFQVDLVGRYPSFERVAISENEILTTQYIEFLDEL